MAKALSKNVTVGTTTYGPDYPDNELTDEVRKEIAGLDVWEGSEDDPMAEAVDKYSSMTVKELVALADRHNPPIITSGRKADLVHRLAEADVASQ